MADLDGLPRLEMGTVDGFFASVEDEAAAGGPVPTGGVSCTSRCTGAR
jgi:hypothetical protein